VDSSFPLFFTSAQSLSSSLFSPGSFPGIRRNGKSVPTTHIITMQSPARDDDAFGPMIAEEGVDKLAECWQKDADGTLVSWAIALASIPYSYARRL
jgi:hypothetical protein